MESIKKINVTICYSVGYGNGNTISASDISEVYADAMEWLNENIKERDCYSWECEIENLEIP